MAINMGAPTPDQHATSTGGDPAHMPDGTIACCNDLGPLPGEAFGPAYAHNSPVPDCPGSQDTTPPGAPGFNGFQLSGNPGPWTEGHYQNFRDTSYPSVPSPDYPGQAGASNQEPQGDPLDFNAIGKERYPEWGTTYTSGGGRALVEGP